VIADYHYEEKPMFVYDKHYAVTEAGPMQPFINEVYLYVFNDDDEVINTVIGLSRRIPEPGDQVTFVIHKPLRGGEVLDPAVIAPTSKFKGKVITKAEYETWHEFNNA